MIEWQIFDFIIIAFAVFRLSLMLVEEDGAFSITYAIRLIGFKPNGKTKLEAYKYSLVRNSWQVHHEITNHIGKLLSCIWCTSIWVALIVPPLYFGLKDTPAVFIFYALAFSGLTILINKKANS